MKSPDVGDLVDLYQLPVGRRLLALARLLAKAKPEELPVVKALVMVALAHDRELLSLARRYATQPMRLHALGAAAIDQEVDRGLSALEMLLNAQAPLYGADSEQAQAAGRIRKAAFPLGVAAVTNLPFVEEHATVTSLLTELQEPESSLAADVTLLGLTPSLERLVTLNARYGKHLSEPPERISYERLSAANREGQRLLRKVVVAVLAAFHDDTPEHVEARTRLLRPVLEQDEAVRLLRRSRRSVVDVDPDTGEEVDSEQAQDEVEAEPVDHHQG